MKKIAVILLCCVVFTSTGFSGEATQVKAAQIRIRQLINAGISLENAERLSFLMKANHVGNSHAEAVCKVLVDTAEKGLPVKPVSNKVFEGLAKKVPGSAIVLAMKQTRSRYEFAYDKAQTLTGNKRQIKRIGDTIAESLAAGLKTEDADSILNSVRQRAEGQKNKINISLTEEAFFSTKTMSRLGVTSSKTCKLVCRVIQENLSAREMRWMHQRFIKQTRNISAEKAVDHYAKSISHGVRKSNSDKLSGKNQKPVRSKKDGSKKSGRHK